MKNAFLDTIQACVTALLALILRYKRIIDGTMIVNISVFKVEDFHHSDLLCFISCNEF